MSNDVLEEERAYLSNLLEAVQRCVYFLHHSEQKLTWPLMGEVLRQSKKDVALFETLAAMNERFAKLQDSIAVAMRHAALLMAEESDHFLKVLGFFEKCGVVESAADWQRSRTARNLAAHDYQIDYDIVAEHFNLLHQLTVMLYGTAKRFLILCEARLAVKPVIGDFTQEFNLIVERSNS